MNFGDSNASTAIMSSVELRHFDTCAGSQKSMRESIIAGL
jgi:hypothetical protein